MTTMPRSACAASRQWRAATGGRPAAAGRSDCIAALPQCRKKEGGGVGALAPCAVLQRWAVVGCSAGMVGKEWQAGVPFVE